MKNSHKPTISFRAQLNRYLYQAERQTVNYVLRQVPKPADRDILRVMLLAHARCKQSLTIRTDDPYLRIMFEGLKPYIEMSLKKAADINYNLAMPADLPTEDDAD